MVFVFFGSLRSRTCAESGVSGWRLSVHNWALRKLSLVKTHLSLAPKSSLKASLKRALSFFVHVTAHMHRAYETFFGLKGLAVAFWSFHPVMVAFPTWRLCSASACRIHCWLADMSSSEQKHRCCISIGRLGRLFFEGYKNWSKQTEG